MEELVAPYCLTSRKPGLYLGSFACGRVRDHLSGTAGPFARWFLIALAFLILLAFLIDFVAKHLLNLLMNHVMGELCLSYA